MPIQYRQDRRRIDGVLLLDKPLGLSSNAALQRVKRLYRAERAGHTGTLDPLATGILPICFGEATKFGGILLEADKGYRTTVRLGMRTTTGDAEGDVIEQSAVVVTRAQLDAALGYFRGEIMQLPPMYSALKHQGRPLYELARKGQTVERKPRSVRIHQLDLVEFSGTDCVLDVICSKGTYIRTLGEDIGMTLGCGAHLIALQRTAVGPYQLAHSRSLEAIEGLSESERDGLLLPVDELVRSWPRATLTIQAAIRFQQGQAVELEGIEFGGKTASIAVYGISGEFLGTGELDGAGRLRPRRLLSSPGPGNRRDDV